MKLLIQTQLSNYNSNGKFILEADSGWQMTMGRVREMLRLVDDLQIDVMGPNFFEVVTSPYELNRDLFQMYGNRLRYISHSIISNALATRFDFDFKAISSGLRLDHPKHIRYDAVYINDPMHLRNFKALFELSGKYQPKFFVHSHFIDNPECPKFPVNASLWLGQCEASLRSDFNFWQCESSMNLFFDSFSKIFNKEQLELVKSKSAPWDDGYSSSEINPDTINFENIRFDIDDILNSGKLIIFVPNRIGGMGRSSDYTNCGKFMFEILPLLYERRQDFVVIAGNPSQKFTNDELVEMCGKYGYLSVVPDALTRDEFKFIANNSDISVGLYDQDSYGGTVARECIDLGCLPLWIDNYEYSSIAKEAGYTYIANPNFSDIVDVADSLMTAIKTRGSSWKVQVNQLLKTIVRNKCSYEETTLIALKQMGLI